LDCLFWPGTSQIGIDEVKSAGQQISATMKIAHGVDADPFWQARAPIETRKDSPQQHGSSSTAQMPLALRRQRNDPEYAPQNAGPP